MAREFRKLTELEVQMILSWYDCAFQIVGEDGISEDEVELSLELDRFFNE